MSNNVPALQDIKIENILASLEQSNLPEAKPLVEYVKAIKNKNIAILGEDEAFILEDKHGQIKAFKSPLTLSAQDGTLIQPTPGGPFVVSAQGYEVWSEKTGTSVIFPKEVLVGNEWRPNPYAERDPNNRRILAVHARAVAFKYSSMGIPQVSDWTTIFDTPSYRMIDLLSKAKKFPQCFKILPKDLKPDSSNGETWASYPFDESMDLYINTSHNEVITWLSQILNREKKAMDFAQTFAKRNALKHLSGIQKAPGAVWRFPVLAWRPTGNNVVKWDATQYAQLQERVGSMISSGAGDDFDTKQAEYHSGYEKVSDEENFDAMEATIDPEDNPIEINPENENFTATTTGFKTEPVQKPTSTPEPEPKKQAQEVKKELSRETKQLISLAGQFSDEYEQACSELSLDPSNPSAFDAKQATLICKKINTILDMAAQ